MNYWIRSIIIMPAANTPPANIVTIQSKVVGDRLLTLSPPNRTQKTECGLFGLLGLPGSWYGGTLISFLRPYISIFRSSSQTLRIQPLRSRRGARVLAAAFVLLSAPAHAQKLGVGGTGVGFSSSSTIERTMPPKTVTAIGSWQRAAIPRFGSRLGCGQPGPRWSPPLGRHLPERQ